MADTAGYVIQGKGSRFLSRKKRYVKHRNHGSSMGVNRAYVHHEAEVRLGGPWVREAVTLYPARYDRELDTTIVTGEPILFKSLFGSRKSA